MKATIKLIIKNENMNLNYFSRKYRSRKMLDRNLNSCVQDEKKLYVELIEESKENEGEERKT
jgi:hypothetical protein